MKDRVTMRAVGLWGVLAGMTLIVTSSGCGGGVAANTTVKFLANKSAEAATSSEASAPSSGGAEAAAGGIGTLKGRVVLQGDFSPLPPLYEKGQQAKDPEVCGAQAAPNESVVVNNGGLANVFIYLEKAPKGAEVAPATEPVIFDQKYCVFKPHALIIRTKQPLKVLNSDSVTHNTKVAGGKNPTKNELLSPNNTTGVNMTYGLAEKSPISVGCDVHPWMRAYHLPLDHSFAAVTSEDGSFEIPNLPAGKHEFRVWHEKVEVLEKAYAVTIKANDVVTVELKYPAAKFK